MPGAGYGKKFSNSFNDSNDNALNSGHEEYNNERSQDKKTNIHIVVAFKINLQLKRN